VDENQRLRLKNSGTLPAIASPRWKGTLNAHLKRSKTASRTKHPRRR
jgi:hypothetical protein